MNAVRYVFFIALITIAFSSCKKDEILEESYLKCQIDNSMFEAADIESEIVENVLEITTIDINGNFIKINISKEIRKGDYDIRNMGLPSIEFINLEGSFKSVSGELKVLEHDRDNMNLRATFSCKLENNDGTAEIQITDGSINLNY
ncbi:MAG: hypothetical protein JEZ03_09310 [Bacteroidales bacterium]|nr:hypothetical protein [Bacteroidales bacterium]